MDKALLRALKTDISYCMYPGHPGGLFIGKICSDEIPFTSHSKAVGFACIPIGKSESIDTMQWKFSLSLDNLVQPFSDS